MREIAQTRISKTRRSTKTTNRQYLGFADWTFDEYEESPKLYFRKKTTFAKHENFDAKMKANMSANMKIHKQFT